MQKLLKIKLLFKKQIQKENYKENRKTDEL